MDNLSRIPPRRPPSSGPTATNATASRSRTPGTGCATRAIRQVEDEDVLAYLKAENAYFEAAMAPHRALVDDTVRGDEGPHQGGRIVGPGPRRRLALLVGVQARRAISHLVPAAGRGRRRADHLRRAGRGRGQGIFPPGRARGQPRRAGSPRSWSTTTARSGSSCASATSPPARTSRRSPTSRIGQPVWTSDSHGIVFTEVNDKWRSYRARYHRLGTPADAGRHALRGDRGARLHRSASRRSQDRSLIFIATGDNATSEVRFVPADDPTAAADARSPPRKEKREYAVDAAHGKLWILTNDDHVNFRLAEADPAEPGRMARRSSPARTASICAASPPTATISPSPQRVDGLDQLVLRTYDGERDGASRSPRRATRAGLRRQSRIRAGRLPAVLFARWSRPRRSTTITRRATGSRSSRSRRSRRATTPRNMRPSG